MKKRIHPSCLAQARLLAGALAFLGLSSGHVAHADVGDWPPTFVCASQWSSSDMALSGFDRRSNVVNLSFSQATPRAENFQFLATAQVIVRSDGSRVRVLVSHQGIGSAYVTLEEPVVGPDGSQTFDAQAALLIPRDGSTQTLVYNLLCEPAYE